MSSINTFDFINNDESDVNNVNLVNNFFDNIADYEEDFSFIQNNENAFNFAMKRALEDNSDNSSINNDFENEVNNNKSEVTVSDISIIDIDAELEITQIINNNNLSKCVLIDVIDGKLQQCNLDVNLQDLWQLIDIWQLDNHAILQAGKDLDKLGICYIHFMFDQNQLHELGIKGRKDVRQSLIHSHRCRFCGKNYYFFSRGKYCKEHS